MLKPLVFAILILSFNGKIISMGDHSVEEGLGDWYSRSETHYSINRNLEKFSDTYDFDNNNELHKDIKSITTEEIGNSSTFLIQLPNDKHVERFKQTVENHLYEQEIQKSKWKIKKHDATAFTLKITLQPHEVEKIINSIKEEIVNEKRWHDDE
jgi:hypothetical protein